jgi:competence protein ComEC
MRLVRRWRERWGELSPLWEALLLGHREGLGRGPQRLLASLGLAHLLALSGLHVGIVSALLLLPLRRWGRRALFYLLLPLLVWAWLAGLSSSLLRAVGMLSWWSVGQRLQRPTRVIDGLAAVALVEIAWRPHALLSVGWWLSYAATAAILRWGNLWQRLPKALGAICVSLAAQAATLPWTLGSFGSFALFAAPLLLLLGPFFGIMLAVGLVVVVLQTVGLVIPGSTLLLAFSSHLFGAAVALAARWMPEPWGHPGIHGLAWAMALAAAGLLLPPWRSHTRWRMGGALGLVLLAHGTQGPGSTATWVSLDVGQGDAAVYRSAGATLVVDSGPWSRRFDPGEAIVLPYLRRRNLRDVDLVITHGHLDHYGGAPALLASGRVGRVHVARCDQGEEWVERLAERAAESGAEVRWISSGDSLRIGDWPVVCLWPPEEFEAEDPNLRSVVLLVGSPQRGLLATGDLERDAEPVILGEHANSLAAVAVLKVAHHGGNTGTDARWLEALSPNFALLSCSRVNRYGHPHPALLERLDAADIPWRRTDRSGAITVRWSAAGEVWVETCR